MKTVKSLFLASFALLLAASCELEPQVSVTADFKIEPEKEAYEIFENITLTNTSYAVNDIIVSCKWEWGNEYKWGKQLTDPISFDTVGDKEITLTVVTDKEVSATCTKIVKIVDTNVRPVADFEYSPATGIRAGDEVQFTDKSTDSDGTVVAWEWKFGTNTVTEQNPKFTFQEFGDIDVTLTVTDNQKGTGSVTKTIHVEKNADSMETLWSKAFSSDGEARVYFTSPALSPDGNTIYVFSSANHLIAFNKDGSQKWDFDATSKNPPTTKNFVSCQPSVDTDGTIFLAIGNKDTQDKTGSIESGIYAINPDGSQKWYYGFSYGWFVNIVPLVLQDKIMVYTKRNPSTGDAPALWPENGADNGLMLNKADGSYSKFYLVKRGSHGGIAATKEETILLHTDSKYGTRVYWKNDGAWKFNGVNAGQDKFMLGYTGVTNTAIGFTSQMAIDGNKVYILYGKADGSSNSSSAAVLFCYDLAKYSATDGATPEWTLDLDGENIMCSGLGAVLGPDGTIYVSTSTGITAVNPDGTKKWFASASGNSVAGCPAVDNAGNIYYHEQVGGPTIVIGGGLSTTQPFNFTEPVESAGKLVKLNAQGKKVSEMTLGQSLFSSPTIGLDGTVYCSGVKDGKPTITAVKGTASGPAAGWSQFGGGIRKSCKAE